MKKIKPKKKTESKLDLYSVSISVGGKVYRAEAETISEALNKIKIDTYKTKAVLEVEHNDIKKQIILTPFILRKLIQPQQRAFFEKRLMILLS